MTVADDQVQARLDELRREYQLGETRLRELMQQETALRETLLRISGAVQVLEELTQSPRVQAETAGSAPSARAGDGASPRPQVLTVPEPDMSERGAR